VELGKNVYTLDSRAVQEARLFQTRRWRLKRGGAAVGSSFKSKHSLRGVGGGGVSISIIVVRGRVVDDDEDEDASLPMGDEFVVGLLVGNCEGGTNAGDDDDGPQHAFWTSDLLVHHYSKLIFDAVDIFSCFFAGSVSDDDGGGGGGHARWKNSAGLRYVHMR
jgi:hypothetical protein